MKYDNPVYIHPPRPQLYNKDSIPKLFNNGDWWAQIKLDDTRNLIILKPDGGIDLYNRHAEKHRGYCNPHPDLIKSFDSLALDRTKYQVFDSLLLHNKNALVKDTIVLMDILVYDGDYLYQVSYEDRYGILNKVCNTPTELEKKSGLELGMKVTDKLWLIQNFEGDFEALYKKWETKFLNGQRIVEGLVFKKKAGGLGYHFTSDKCNWQGKIRYPKKNYDF